MGWNRQWKIVISLCIVFLLSPLNAFANTGKLIPMGHSIGIKMDLSGVFITHDVLVEKGIWLKSGDLIEQIGEMAIRELDDFNKVAANVKPQQHVTMQYIRDGKSNELQTDTSVMKRLLPFLKDRTEGTGTLTYVDPETKVYGALGHQIIDSALQSPPLFKNGAIYLSEVGQIKKSVPGVPGYKISTILDENDFLGTIKRNDIYGIFGSWKDSTHSVLSDPMEIMQPDELKTGAATILTTVKGSAVEHFDIKITKIEQNQFQFVVTDTKILERTGGILQGMSGSPILQNGKFAGAVTHMFVDEPQKGAGIFLITMRKGEK